MSKTINLQEIRLTIEIRGNWYDVSLKDLKAIRKRRIKKLPKIPTFIHYQKKN